MQRTHRRMLVVAFDGILFDTLDFRANIVAEALAAERFEATLSDVRALIAGRTIAETIRAMAEQIAGIDSAKRTSALHSGLDETAIDLATLRAKRAVSQLSSRGAHLNVAVRDRLRRAVAISRIVIRADSERKDVEPLLALADLEAVASFVRCSDDSSGNRRNLGKPKYSDHPEPHSSTSPLAVDRSYDEIARRMYGNMTLLGTSADIGVALETSEIAREAARRHGYTTPDSFDSAKLPGERHE